MIFAHQLSGEVALHSLPRGPSKVLDLGCGTGSWIVNATVHWKDTHFVGLDIVALQPDLEQVAPEFASCVA